MKQLINSIIAVMLLAFCSSLKSQIPSHDSTFTKDLTQDPYFGEKHHDLVNILIRICHDTISPATCACEYPGASYEDVKTVFKTLLKVSQDRLQFTGKIPNIKICTDFNAPASFYTYDDYKKIFIQLMMQELNLKRVYQKTELCEVLVVEASNNLHVPSYKGKGRKSAGSYIDAYAIGYPLSHFAELISLLCPDKTIESRFGDDTTLYNFRIPGEVTKKLETLQKYLLDTYGIVLKKENQSATITVVEF